MLISKIFDERDFLIISSVVLIRSIPTDIDREVRKSVVKVKPCK